MKRKRGRFLKSLEEEVSLLRPEGGNRRKVILQGFKAICLVSRASDDSNQDTNLFQNAYTVNITPAKDEIQINDLIVRHKLLRVVDSKNVTKEELCDARGGRISNAVLTVLHVQDNRNIQQLRCKALLEGIT